jgi:hypothetical protein
MEPMTALRCSLAAHARRSFMFKGAALWMLGIPLPIILILWFMGYL